MGKVLKFKFKTKEQREKEKLKKRYEEAKNRILEEAKKLDW